ncbi:MAG: hypothetical protein AAGF10_04450 [Verrucomicrobiota bacterium]
MSDPEESPPAQELRKLIHDINGEIFLIRGNAEVALHKSPDDHPLGQQLREIIERSEAVEAKVKKLRKQQLAFIAEQENA